MTKKDLEAIAKIIYDERVYAEGYGEDNARINAYATIARIERRLIEYFKKQNPRFDAAHFEKACDPYA